MKSELELANFIISTPYPLTLDDMACIEKASHGHPVKEDWQAASLDKFKDRVRKFYHSVQRQKCAYCRMDVSLATGYFHIEHIVAKSVHPEWMYKPENLCLVCPVCNSSKNNKDILQAILC